MFIVTGMSHFSPRMRTDFVRTVPPVFPSPAALVTLTGGLELLGAFAFPIPSLRIYAAVGLILHANVYAARRNIAFGIGSLPPSAICIPIQLLYGALALGDPESQRPWPRVVVSQNLRTRRRTKKSF